MSVEACLTFPYGKTASARYQKNAKVKKVSFRNLCSLPGAPLTYFNDGGGGGGGGPRFISVWNFGPKWFFWDVTCCFEFLWALISSLKLHEQNQKFSPVFSSTSFLKFYIQFYFIFCCFFLYLKVYANEAERNNKYRRFKSFFKQLHL